MALQRTNPLPLGAYWIDLFRPTTSRPDQKDQLPRFEKWIQDNGGAVRVISSQTFDEDLLGGPIRAFVIFSVRQSPPVPWPFRELGFPNISDRSVQSSDDTVQKPPPEQPPGFFEGFLGGMSTGTLLALAALWYVSSNNRK